MLQVEEMDAMDLLKMVDDSQVDSWVSDLLEEDDDEAELPSLAYRAPIVMAAGVEAGKPSSLLGGQLQSMLFTDGPIGSCD